MSNPGVVDLLVVGQYVKIFRTPVPSNFGLEGWYLCFLPPHRGTLQAAQGFFDGFGSKVREGGLDSLEGAGLIRIGFTTC